jgi:hypothetical protein
MLLGAAGCRPPPTTSSPSSPPLDERLIAIDGSDGSTRHCLAVPGRELVLDEEGGYLYPVGGAGRVAWDEQEGVVTVDGRRYGVVLDGLDAAGAGRAIDALAFAPRLVSFKRGSGADSRWLASLARRRGPPLVLDLGGWRGPLPSLDALGARLEALVLADVELRAADVALLARLPALRWLDLSGARLAPRALHALADRARLRTLLLRAVPLDDGDLTALARLGELEELDLGGCGVSAAQLARLRPAARWRRLGLRAATVDAVSLRAICRQHPLRALNLSDASLGDSTVALGDCRHLRQLSLARTDVGPADVATLRMLPALVDLDLGWTELRGVDLTALPALERLQRLALDGLDLSAGIASLRAARGLRVLSLRAARADDRIAPTLATLGELRAVLLGRTGIGDATIAALAVLRHLEVLDLFQTRISDAAAPHLAAHRGLRVLDLEGTAAGDATASAVAGLTALRSLSLSKTRVGDHGLTALRPLMRLRRLELRWLRCIACPMAAVARPDLRELNLSGMPVTDAEMAAVAALPRLHELVLYGTRVGDAALSRLEGCRRLRYVHVGGTRATLEGARALARALPRCHVHVLPGAGGISVR